MSWDRYRVWREDWGKHVAQLPLRKGGFATPAEKAINRNGRMFAKLVLEALNANQVTSGDAACYLDLKFEHFDSPRRRFRDQHLVVSIIGQMQRSLLWVRSH